jgi:hypothetical protein
MSNPHRGQHVSKSSRRRHRSGTQPPPPSRPSGPATPGRPSTGSGGTAAAAGSGAARPSGSIAGAAGSSAGSTAAGSRPAGAASRPTGTRPRAGRRERQRVAYQPSFLERYRTALVVGVAIVGVALISVFVFFSASQPAFACTTIWTPSPTASPSPGATPNLGYAQPDMGHNHIGAGEKVTYTYCAPASGNHVNRPGTAGPIPARVYGPGDSVIPQGWIHNLEHGGLVVLYRGDSPGATPDGQAQLRAFQSAFPPVENCGPVIARFDQMSTPFQALLWGRVLLMDSWDPALVTAFWNQWGGRTNLEQLCPTPNAQGSPAPSTSPSGAPSSSAAPSDSPAASAVPSAPATSAAPSAAASPS